MGDRQADLQNAFADGDDVQILEFTSRMAKGAELLIQLTRQSEMSDDRMRASVMKKVLGFLQGTDRRCTWRWMRDALDWTGPTMCARREDGSC